MKIGVVGIPNGWSSIRLVDAFKERDAEAVLIDMAQVLLNLNEGTAYFQGTDLRSFDALAIKKIGTPYAPELLDRLAMLRFLAETGLPVFSNPAMIKRVLGRLSCTVTLGSTNIPLPPTVITESIDQAVEALNVFGKAVLKPIYTSKARGMVVVEAGETAREAITQFRDSGNPVIYMQQFLQLPGSDMGVVFLGGRCLGCYARVGSGTSWNTTTHSGGKYEFCEATPEVIELATRAQAPFNLDFTCVDIAETDRGLVVFEVSAFGGFRGLLEAASIDAADLYAEYILGKLQHD